MRLLKILLLLKLIPSREYLYGLVPPVAVTVNCPELSPLQSRLRALTEALKAAGWEIITVRFAAMHFSGVTQNLKVDVAGRVFMNQSVRPASFI